jgi:hypothetical protein
LTTNIYADSRSGGDAASDGADGIDVVALGLFVHTQLLLHSLMMLHFPYLVFSVSHRFFCCDDVNAVLKFGLC